MLTGHSQDVKCVRFHPLRDDYLLSASYDNTVKVWSEEDDDWYNTESLTDHASTVWALALDKPAGTRLATCGDDSAVLVYERVARPGAAAAAPGGGEGEMVWARAATLANAHSRTVYAVDWSALPPDSAAAAAQQQQQQHQSQWLATCGADDAVCVFALAGSADDGGGSGGGAGSGGSGGYVRVVHQQRAHAGDVNCLMWNQNRERHNWLATCGDDGLVKVWRLV